MNENETLLNKVDSLEKQVKIQQDHIGYLESIVGKTVNDQDIIHESLKILKMKCSSDTVFKMAIQWYRDQLTSKP